MKKYIRNLKILINEIFFGITSFLIAASILTLWRNIFPDPEVYFLALLFHIVEIITLMSVVRNIMEKVPGIFKVRMSKDNTLGAATVLLLVDWTELNEFMKKLRV